jgi:hypothetical protein
VSLLDDDRFRLILEKVESLDRKLDAMRADTCWVTREEYCRYNGVCRTTLWKNESWLRKKGAVKGFRKAARFNKFFSLEHKNNGGCL